MNLIQTMGYTLHKRECYTVRRARVYRRFVVEDGEVGEFLRARKLEPCGACLKELKRD